jgi:hypothetical protein
MEIGMSFAEEYKRLYNDTMKQIFEHRDHVYECLLIKQQFEEQKQYLIKKYNKRGESL